MLADSGKAGGLSGTPPAQTFGGPDQWTSAISPDAGVIYLYAEGLATAKLTLQVSPNGTDWFDAPDKEAGDAAGKYVSNVGLRKILASNNCFYRLGIKAGDHSAGNARGRIFG